jgi:hypothetical protein
MSIWPRLYYMQITHEDNTIHFLGSQSQFLIISETVILIESSITATKLITWWLFQFYRCILLTARTTSQPYAPRHLTTLKLILRNVLHNQWGRGDEYVKSYLTLGERSVKVELLLLLALCLGNYGKQQYQGDPKYSRISIYVKLEYN